MKPQNTDLNHVRILAKKEAQKTGIDQKIYEGYERGFSVFGFKPVTEKSVGIETVCYAKPAKVRAISTDTKDEQLKPVKKRPATDGSEASS
jgi:hypothetical protein